MQLYIVATRYMTKKDKLIRRFLKGPLDFQFQELVTLLGFFGYYEVAKGKTSGSRVRFMNDQETLIVIHKPHAGKSLKRYQLKLIKEILEL